MRVMLAGLFLCAVFHSPVGWSEDEISPAERAHALEVTEQARAREQETNEEVTYQRSRCAIWFSRLSRTFFVASVVTFAGVYYHENYYQPSIPIPADMNEVKAMNQFVDALMHADARTVRNTVKNLKARQEAEAKATPKAKTVPVSSPDRPAIAPRGEASEIEPEIPELPPQIDEPVAPPKESNPAAERGKKLRQLWDKKN